MTRRKTLGTAAILGSLLIGTPALAQTVPGEPLPTPADPNNCADQTLGIGAGCLLQTRPTTPDRPLVRQGEQQQQQLQRQDRQRNLRRDLRRPSGAGGNALPGTIPRGPDD